MYNFSAKIFPSHAHGNLSTTAIKFTQIKIIESMVKLE